jgi:hairy-and-enhancer-of-split protein
MTAISDTFDMEGEMTETPMSRTHQYRKVMKPLLERKRRARINKCLDELKELMVHALQHEGENISKLEKADVLELTVRHLQKLKRQQMLALNPALDLDRFHAGYTACATEVNQCLISTPCVDITLGTRLMSHLGQRLALYKQEMPSASHSTPLGLQVVCSGPLPQQPFSSPHNSDSDLGYNSGRESSSPSPSSSSSSSCRDDELTAVKKEPESVWRPF